MPDSDAEPTETLTVDSLEQPWEASQQGSSARIYGVLSFDLEDLAVQQDDAKEKPHIVVPPLSSVVVSQVDDNDDIVLGSETPIATAPTKIDCAF